MLSTTEVVLYGVILAVVAGIIAAAFIPMVLSLNVEFREARVLSCNGRAAIVYAPGFDRVCSNATCVPVNATTGVAIVPATWGDLLTACGPGGCVYAGRCG